MNRDYKILREIGRGGMAVVYLAKALRLNRLVAVKILNTDTMEDQDYIKRFFREARITARLDHPNIIRVLESNYSGGQCYIITEYIDGGDFRQFLKNSRAPLELRLKIISTVVGALDHAHQQGIVHRDVKPSNILLTKEFEPKLCDFGIATALWGQESRITRTYESIGTMDYIAPEQKESSKNVDFRADIYALGVILYETITGRRPQGAFPSPGTVVASIPKKLDDCVMKCLQPWPYKRYKSTRNLYDELKNILDLEMPLSSPASKTRPSTGPLMSTHASASAAPHTTPSLKTTATGHRAGTSRILARDAEPASIPGNQAPPPTFDDMIKKLKGGSITQKLSFKNQLFDSISLENEEELLRQLEEAEGFLKETLIEALGKIKSKRSCSYLIELLDEPYYNKVAANAVGEIGCKEAEHKLFNLLISNRANAHAALLPLGKLNCARAVKDMARFLKSPHDWIRETALDALASITPDSETGRNVEKKIKDYIQEASRTDANAHIRAKAKKILWRITK